MIAISLVIDAKKSNRLSRALEGDVWVAWDWLDFESCDGWGVGGVTGA